MAGKKKKKSLADKVESYIKMGQSLYKAAMAPLEPSKTLPINKNEKRLLKKVN